MRKFLDENFLLGSRAAEQLYHDHAKSLPIIDYHNHLPPDEIEQDRHFQNLTQAWLKGDHYKWRAMRAYGIDERFITGNATDVEKFEKWALTVPATLRNPLYHWTHLELKNPFGIEKLLGPDTASEIYKNASEKLASTFSARRLLGYYKVEVVCTTDDPSDSLSSHQSLKRSDFSVRVLPTFRPDKAMSVEEPAIYNAYLDTLGMAANVEINSWANFLDALRKRHDFFGGVGCRLSDHGIETFYADDYTESEITSLFLKVRSGKSLNEQEVVKFKSACLYELAKMDHAKGWVQQFHVGAIRNNSTRLMKLVGADSGADSIADLSHARSMARFFDRLDRENSLSKTIVYNLNPADNEMIATMCGNYNDGAVPGKMQYGSAWWFLDQKDGIEKQLNVLSNMGLLSKFVGMLTDSRSFLSFSRHEYFRRILCNVIGEDVEKGELPADMNLLGKLVEDICYNNAKSYFDF